MTRKQIENLMIDMNFDLKDGWTCLDLIPFIEKFLSDVNSYFIFKIDGERLTNKYTFVVYVSWESSEGEIIRKDTDNIEEGFLHVLVGIQKAIYKNENLFR